MDFLLEGQEAIQREVFWATVQCFDAIRP